MNSYKNENSFKKNVRNKGIITSNKILFLDLKFAHKIFDSINFSLLTLIIILSFLSFNSQRDWTNIYRYLAKTKAKNNNLIDYISMTEEFYINKNESLKTFKKTTPKDLIYLLRPISKEKKNNLFKNLEYIQNGLKDSHYERGY